MKKCKRCGIEKSLDEYYVHKEMADGHLNVCKECVKKRVKGYGDKYDKRRRNTPKRKKWLYEFQKKMRKKYIKKYRCRNRFWKSVLRNEIEKKKECVKCGVSGEKKRIEAHHCDYDKPFDVMWLCSKCHHEWHKENEPLNQE
jgi:hypothetical protein